jgi:Ribosomal protein L13e
MPVPLFVLQENANRLKAYKTNLVVFPRRSKKPKAGDSPAEQLQTVRTLISTLTGRLRWERSRCLWRSEHLLASRRELHGLQVLELGYAHPDSSVASLEHKRG